MNLMTRLAAALALTLAATGAHAANVLVVLSDENHLDLKDGKVLSTGFYLNELMQPVKLLLDAGHEVTFATPQGRAPTVDASSATPAYFGNDAAQLTLHKALLEKLALTSPTASPVVSLARVEQQGYARFDAVYIPGGLDAGAMPATPKWIYSGYQMTVISNQEEEQAKPLLGGGEMKFYPQTALQRAGARFSSNATPWTGHVVVDRELITGQNPASALEVGQRLVERLKMEKNSALDSSSHQK